MQRRQRFTSVWAREVARRREVRGNPSGLSREQIVREAVALLDAEGADALSMRRLAARLGSGATSLYWYVANKDELLELAADEVLAEVARLVTHPDTDGAHWRELGSRYAYGLRDVILRHPWLGRQVGVRPLIGPNALAVNARLCEAFAKAGFRGRDVDYAVGAITAFALGTALPEAAWRNGLARLGIPEEEWEKQVRADMELSAERYPELLRLSDEWMGCENPTVARRVAFDFGLVSLLDGLEARLRP